MIVAADAGAEVLVCIHVPLHVRLHVVVHVDVDVDVDEASMTSFS